MLLHVEPHGVAILLLCYATLATLLLGALQLLPPAQGAGQLPWLLVATCIGAHAPALALQTVVTQLDALTMDDLLSERASGAATGAAAAAKALGLGIGPARINTSGLANRELNSLAALAPPLMRSALTALTAFAPLPLFGPMTYLRSLGLLVLLAIALATLLAVVAVPILHVIIRRPPPPPPPPPPEEPLTGAARRKHAELEEWRREQQYRSQQWRQHWQRLLQSEGYGRRSARRLSALLGAGIVRAVGGVFGGVFGWPKPPQTGRDATSAAPWDEFQHAGLVGASVSGTASYGSCGSTGAYAGGAVFGAGGGTTSGRGGGSCLDSWSDSGRIPFGATCSGLQKV